MTVNLPHGSGCQPGASPSVHLDLSAQITAAIDAGIARERPEYAPTGNVGFSQLGDECMRKLVYIMRKAERAPTEPKMRRIFEAGHEWEAIIIKWLRWAGFDVRDRNS